MTEIDTVTRKSGNDPTFAEELAHLRREAEDVTKSALLSAGSLDLTSGRFRDAMEHVNRVLAMQPDHRLALDMRALDMRARIEIAANEWSRVQGLRW